MCSFKDFYWFFSLLIIGKVNCAPVDHQSKCTIPPKLKALIPKLDENLRGCQNTPDESMEFYCKEIQKLAFDINGCNLGGLWLMRVAENDEINPIDYNQDICWNFGTLSKSIEYSSDKNSLGQQITRNLEFCHSFCDFRKDACHLMLQLYWIKGELLYIRNEISKNQSTKENLPDAGKNKSKQTSKKENINSDSNKKPEIQTESNIIKTPPEDLGPKVDKSTNKKDDKKLNETKVAQPTVSPDKEKENKSTSVSLKITATKPKVTEKITEMEKLSTVDSKVKKNEPNVPTPEINKINPASDSSQKFTKISKPVGITTTNDNSNKFNPDIVTVDDETKNVDNEPITDGNSDKPILETEFKPQSRPFNDMPSDSTNDLDLEKSGKTEFGNQANEFNEAFADPSNEYGEEEPPLDNTVNMGKTSDKEGIVKKVETNSGTENRIKTGFPEEEDGHFFAYFLTIVVLCIAGYLVFHNKQKIIALIIEGRHERRRRPNGGGYKRLDNKDSAKTTSQVIF